MKTPITIAKHLINEAHEKGIHDISPSKLQKLLYLIYLEYAKKYKEPLFQEKFNVTREGFILSSLNGYYKTIGAHEYLEVPGKYGLDDLYQKTRYTINKVLDYYGYIPVYNLVDYIHGGSLWRYCMSKGVRTIGYLDLMDKG